MGYKKEAYAEKYSGDSKAMEKLPRNVAGFFQAVQAFFSTIMMSAKMSKMDSIARFG